MQSLKAPDRGANFLPENNGEADINKNGQIKNEFNSDSER